MTAEDLPVALPDFDEDARDRVLVVDDEESVRGLFVRVLERAGFEASEAADGAVALDSIAQSLPDVVLLDCTMPRLTGLEVVTALRGDPRTATLPVILITGQGESTTASRGSRPAPTTS